LEMFEEIGNLDMMLVPCGGGGLLSGLDLLKHTFPDSIQSHLLYV